MASRPAPQKTAKPMARRTKQAPAQQPFRMPELTPTVARILNAVALLMVVGGAVLWLRAWVSNPESLRITQVDWQGDFQYLKKAELEALAAPYLATNLYLLDADNLEVALEGHEWVRGVSLRKLWPSQLVVEVEAHHPIAFWGDERLLNQFGEIFPGTLPEKQGVFPVIYSPQDDNGREMAERYVQLLQALKGLDLDIVELSEDERGSWRMKLRHGPEVIIGRKEQEKRVQRFRVGYMQGLRQQFGEIDRIDLRYTNGFAVEWKPGSGNGGAVSSLGRHAQRDLRS